MSNIILHLPAHAYAAIRDHLLESETDDEEAAFIFAGYEKRDGHREFRFLNWIPVPEDGFAYRSAFHFELSDEFRAHIIKRAHDLGASLVELHSHLGDAPARFSLSDLSGLEEWVPHILWRLDKRPYAAVVVARSSIDGIAWTHGAGRAERLHAIATDSGETIIPTHLTTLGRPDHDE